MIDVKTLKDVTPEDVEDLKVFHNQYVYAHGHGLTEVDLRLILRSLEVFKLEHIDAIERDEGLFAFEYLEDRVREAYHFLYAKNRFGEFQDKRNRDRRLQEEQEAHQNALRERWFNKTESEETGA